MEKALSPLRRKDIETGRKLEREAIVAWFMREAEAIRKDADDGFWGDFTESEVQEAIEDEINNANLIRDGVHLK